LLSALGGARPGTPLVVSDCYGDIGEIWAEG
jgi:hypothetical protein